MKIVKSLRTFRRALPNCGIQKAIEERFPLTKEREIQDRFVFRLKTKLYPQQFDALK